MNIRQILITVLALSFISLASANPPSPNSDRNADRNSPQGQRSGPDNRLHPEDIEQALDLSFSQRNDFHDIMRAQMEKVHAFMEKNQAETRDKLSSVLTAEQLDAYDKLVEANQPQRRNKGQRPDRNSQRGNNDQNGSNEPNRQFRFAD
ncbi:hypothetical protein [Litoribrevibacter albus]|nr:hypothetical protein [Litoribrevibacter albus]